MTPHSRLSRGGQWRPDRKQKSGSKHRSERHGMKRLTTLVTLDAQQLDQPRNALAVAPLERRPRVPGGSVLPGAASPQSSMPASFLVSSISLY